MDIIFIKGLVIPTIIGVYSWERCTVQKLVFDLYIGYNLIKVSSDINIDYLDYQKVSDFIVFLVKKKRFFLIESLAESVAEELLSNFNISWVRVKLSKPGALLKGIQVGVMIERVKNNVGRNIIF